MPELSNIRRGLMFCAPRELWSAHHHPGRLLAEAELAEIKAAAAGARPAYTARDGVALIPIKGLMVKYPLWYDETSTVAATVAVSQAAADKSVKAIMLVIDSPGGEVQGVAELADAIYSARSVKPVVAQVDGMAASAAYWAASQAGKVFAHQLDTVGSIGVYSLVMDDSAWAEKQGIKIHLVTTGEFKGAGEVGQAVTEAQLADRQRIVNTFFGAFKAGVSRGRGMDSAAVDRVADGRVWIGAENQRLGLIDGISDFSTTFKSLSASVATALSPDPRLSTRTAAARVAVAEAELKLTGPAAESARQPAGKA